MTWARPYDFPRPGSIYHPEACRPHPTGGQDLVFVVCKNLPSAAETPVEGNRQTCPVSTKTSGLKEPSGSGPSILRDQRPQRRRLDPQFQNGVGVLDLTQQEQESLQLACRLHSLSGLLGLYVTSATPGSQRLSSPHCNCPTRFYVVCVLSFNKDCKCRIASQQNF